MSDSYIDVGPIVMSVPCGELFGALAKAQGTFEKLTKDNTASIPGKDGKKGYEYSYADLGSTIEICRPHLAKHGLAVVQAPVTSARGIEVSTMLTHESGQWILIKPLFMPTDNKPQAIGSAITYARRYQWQPALGLAAEDDDGEGAQSNPPPKPSKPKQRAGDDDIGPRCTGKASGIAKTIDELVANIAAILGKDERVVYRSAIKGAGIDLGKYGNVAPGKTALLTVADGNAIKAKLRAKLDELDGDQRQPGDDGDDPTEGGAP